MRILVSGGAGFLGSNLCERLLGYGDNVWCLDNLATGSEENISNLYGCEKFHFIAGNAASPPDIKVDQIYSLASPTAPGAYMADPEGTIEANVAGTKAMLNLADRYGAKMLLTSSIRVTEPLEPDSPHSCYVESKRRAEELCLKASANGTNVKIARLYNSYGPRMSVNDSRVMPQFITRALKGEELKIVGDGTQRDAFCYIDDMIDALIAYMESDFGPGPLELGYPVPIAIIDLARLVIKLTDSKSKIVFNGIQRSARELEIKKMRPIPDIREAEKKLGWRPRIGYEDGIRRTADFFRERL